MEYPWIHSTLQTREKWLLSDSQLCSRLLVSKQQPSESTGLIIKLPHHTTPPRTLDLCKKTTFFCKSTDLNLNMSCGTVRMRWQKWEQTNSEEITVCAYLTGRQPEELKRPTGSAEQKTNESDTEQTAVSGWKLAATWTNSCTALRLSVMLSLI